MDRKIMDKILQKEVSFHTSRSSGKGGQHVNKVETRVELRFDVIHSRFLNAEEKQVFMKKLRKRINKDGIFHFTCDSHRTQLSNRKKIILQFYDILEKAFTLPKKRIKTKPSETSKKKRIHDKKCLSAKKKDRKENLFYG